MPADTYAVWLSTASFSPADTPGYTQGNFVFLLLVNNQPQSQLELTVEAQTTSPTVVIQQAQTQLGTALQGWLSSLSS